METIKNFYNGLDFLSLLLFWGTIIVAILIIIFLILYFSKKRTNNEDIDDGFDIDDDNLKSDISIESFSDNDIDIIKNDNFTHSIQTISDDDNDKVNEEINLDDTVDIPIYKKNIEVKKDDSEKVISNRSDTKVEKNTVIREDNVTDVNNVIIEKRETVEEKKDEFLFDELVKKDSDDRSKAYQRNVFREMNSRNQTSPIGIIYEHETNPIEEYRESLSDKKDTYLEDVYSSLSKANVPDRVELTEYEKKQEEDAVISYGELVSRKSRLYNIREEDVDKEFLSELKEFRKDL